MKDQILKISNITMISVS